MTGRRTLGARRGVCAMTAMAAILYPGCGHDFGGRLGSPTTGKMRDLGLIAHSGEGTAYTRDCATLSDDSTVITGSFASVIDFDPSHPFTTYLVASGESDRFVAKYDATGKWQWARAISRSAYGSGIEIVALSDDSMIITGSFHGTVTFGPGEADETVLSSEGWANRFLARYSSDGTLMWARTSADVDSFFGNGAMAALSDDSVVVTGDFLDTARFAVGESNETTLTVIGGPGVFVARYDAYGTLLWATCAEGTGYEGYTSVTSLSDDSIVVTGNFYETATFGKDEANETLLSQLDPSHMFAARYASDGMLLWAKRGGGICPFLGNDSVAALKDDSFAVTGYLIGDTVFGAGEANETILACAGDSDMFVARYDSDGALVWARRAGGEGYIRGRAIATLSDDSIAVAGQLRGTATFGEGEANATGLARTGYSDMFLARYDQAGRLAWVARAGGSGGEGDVEACAVSAISDGSVMVAGGMHGNTEIVFGAEDSPRFLVKGCPVFLAWYYP